MAWKLSGSSARTRTSNLVVNSHPLCRLSYRGIIIFNGGGTQIRTGDKGFAVLCLTTWLCRRNSFNEWSGRRDLNPRPQPWQGCALPLSYFRVPFQESKWWRDPELNWGHADFQSAALPSELSRLKRIFMAGPTRLELATSGVTGRHSNRLSYDPAFNPLKPWWAEQGSNL